MLHLYPLTWVLSMSITMGEALALNPTALSSHTNGMISVGFTQIAQPSTSVNSSSPDPIFSLTLPIQAAAVLIMPTYLECGWSKSDYSEIKESSNATILLTPNSYFDTMVSLRLNFTTTNKITIPNYMLSSSGGSSYAISALVFMMEEYTSIP